MSHQILHVSHFQRMGRASFKTSGEAGVPHARTASIIIDGIWGQGPTACHDFFFLPSHTPLASRATLPSPPPRSLASRPPVARFASKLSRRTGIRNPDARFVSLELELPPSFPRTSSTLEHPYYRPAGLYPKTVFS